MKEKLKREKKLKETGEGGGESGDVLNDLAYCTTGNWIITGFTGFNGFTWIYWIAPAADAYYAGAYALPDWIIL